MARRGYADDHARNKYRGLVPDRRIVVRTHSHPRHRKDAGILGSDTVHGYRCTHLFDGIARLAWPGKFHSRVSDTDRRLAVQSRTDYFRHSWPRSRNRLLAADHAKNILRTDGANRYTSRFFTAREACDGH